nr:immunoglobulin light chain junction region [Macaca mulatta]MOX08642.1 immunoglobulin light chain junction region [Macaca mulatta]MOX08876.1 immunoglobulin light chain junction region [Macaca mulatta]
CLQYNSIPWTF